MAAVQVTAPPAGCPVYVELVQLLEKALEICENTARHETAYASNLARLTQAANAVNQHVEACPLCLAAEELT